MPDRPFDIAACVQRVRRGDEEAARLLLEQLYPLVIKLVRSHLPRRLSEEDLVQTIFMKMFANLGQYSGRVPLEHWLSRIAVNTCLNELKAEKIRPELRWSDMSEEEQHVLESLAATGDELLPSHALAARELVHKLLASLSAQDRFIIHSLHLEDRSLAEIRQLTGWSIPRIKVRAFRARKKLQKYLRKLTHGEPP